MTLVKQPDSDSSDIEEPSTSSDAQPPVKSKHIHICVVQMTEVYL